MKDYRLTYRIKSESRIQTIIVNAISEGDAEIRMFSFFMRTKGINQNDITIIECREETESDKSLIWPA